MISKFILYGSCSLIFSTTVLASGVTLRWPDGSIRNYSFEEAKRACPAGTHLPTVRELAKECQKRGAKGIFEVSEVDPNDPPFFFGKISAINLDGAKDEFYFEEKGYQPGDGLEDSFYWTSSIDAVRSYEAYILHGDQLYAGPWAHGANAVFCIPNN